MRCVFNTSRIHILSNRWISDNYRTNFDKEITKKLGFFLIRLGSLDQKKHIMIIITQDTSSQTWFNLHIEYDLLKFDSSLQLALVKVLWSGLFMILPAIPWLVRTCMQINKSQCPTWLNSSSCEGQISFGLWGRGCNTFPKSSSCTGQGRIWQLTLSRLGCRRFLIWIDET